MIRFEDIVDRVETNDPAADSDFLRQAYVLSAKVHRGQKRRSGEPYLVHPLEVAGILADWGMDSTSVGVGLLHDVVEDTLTTLSDLERIFGRDASQLVGGLTKLSKLAFTSTEEHQAESFRKMLLAVVDDIRVMIIKLADRLHNMRTLSYLPPRKQVRIAQETLDIYAPIANRLGMGRVKSEMEDLAFRYLEPERYEELKRRLAARERASRKVIARIRAKISETLAEAGIEAHISGRVKRLYSIYQKMIAQSIGVDEVYDYLAFRIICDSLKECYAALGLIHQIWSPVPGRFKDYIAIPKANGYRSIHTSVLGERGQPFEVQIRTNEMHIVAEEGIASHWKYKESGEVNERDEEVVKGLRRLVESSAEIRDSREFLSALKVDLYPDEVYIFTPRGEVKSFPRGSTPIDFAYSIHTEIGHTCVGSKVNGSLVQLKTPLRNGDVVEIMTAPGHVPSRDWLGWVKTSRARSKIRQYLRAAARGRSVEVGKRIVERDLRRHHHSPKELEEHEDLDKTLSALGVASLDDLYAAVSYGKVSSPHLLKRLFGVGPEPERSSRLPVADKPGRILVKGLDDVLVTLAHCCRPVKGEEIVGYISRGKGVSVHSRQCSNVEQLLLEQDRIIEVDWDKRGVEAYPAHLDLAVIDEKGILARITSAIAGTDTDIRGVEARVTGSEGRIDVYVAVADISHLARLIDSIRQIPGVLSVHRRLS